MNPWEREMWAATGRLYNGFRVGSDMETARASIVTQLRMMADEIEDRTRLPDGTPTEDDSLIED